MLRKGQKLNFASTCCITLVLNKKHYNGLLYIFQSEKTCGRKAAWESGGGQGKGEAEREGATGPGEGDDGAEEVAEGAEAEGGGEWVEEGAGRGQETQGASPGSDSTGQVRLPGL